VPYCTGALTPSGNAARVFAPQARHRQSCARCSVTTRGSGSGRSNTCRALWPRIHYPFHPRCGETAVVVRRQRFQGGDVFVVHQLDGTLAHIPCWMMSEAAAHHELRSTPRLPLEHLRDLRIEIDSLLDFLRLDSKAEGVVDEAHAGEAASRSVRGRRSADRRAE